ncbi:MAG TPA: hypothetical protein DHD79_12275 [Firmicutes bacterium]|jgi:uncharacterized protein YqgV (UPF0045/DUF77 family)|nr:hypothetical protein [Bacillota bacterium]HAZ22557.1 hypothetical protein [Bacillota bacterium]HBE06022.1 hypothetical protein [Bacillota bacterium]HBG42926.1 hypothetical protein [Bacillota bacterium]HBL49915.1 hypothetical protein [Bacillota bacterium]
MKSAMSIQVLPVTDAGKDEVFRLVDRAIEKIKESGLTYMVGPFETTVEGDLERLFILARQAHETVVKESGGRVFTYMKIVTAPDLGTSAEKVDKYRNG